MKSLNFVQPREISTVVEFAGGAIRNDSITRGATQPASDTFHLTADEGEGFLRIVSQTSRIKRHYELFQLLQGEVQNFIPHQVLISAWGDFRGPNLEFDVISAIPEVRTGRLNCYNIDSLIKDLHLRWLTHGRQPMLLNSATDARLMQSGCGCAFHKSLQCMWSVLVHGVLDARDGSESLYLAANASSIVKGGSIERYRFLVDPVIAQIDVAFRRVAGLKASGTTAYQEPPSKFCVLSAREEEIITWVSEGRTNVEISKILAISSFTVKNHVQRIIKKLNATNRTEAVAKYRQMGGQVRRKSVGRDAVLVAD